jgi:hypothetical protein
MKFTYLKQHPIRTFFIGIVALFFLNISYDLLYITFFGKDYKYEPECHWQEGCPTHVFGNGAFQISSKHSRGYSLWKGYYKDKQLFYQAIVKSLTAYLEVGNFGYARGIDYRFAVDEEIEEYILLDLKTESYTTYKTLAEIPKEHQENFKKMIPLE